MNMKIRTLSVLPFWTAKILELLPGVSLTNAFKFSTTLALLIFTGIGRADSLDTWTLRNPLPTANALHGIVYGNNQFVAVGAGGTTLTSADGTAWVLRQSPTENALFGIAFGNGQFVAVGELGTVMTSTDGSSWIQRQSVTSFPLLAVAYGEGQFVAVGGGYGFAGPYGIIVTSADGINWVRDQSGSTTWFNGIAYVNGVFVAVGYRGRIITSTDGTNWVQRESGIGGASGSLTIAYGNGQFVAVGNEACDDIVLTSVDAVSWSESCSDHTVYPAAIAYGNGQFVGVGGSNHILTSTDGGKWVVRQSGMPSDDHYPTALFAIAYGSSQFVTVGDFGTILTSADGVKWFRAQPKELLDFSDIAYGNGEFVAVGNSYNTASSRWEGASGISPDGLSWTQAHLGPGTGLNRITYGNGQFVASGYWSNNAALGSETNILTSTDGINWIPRQSGTTNALGALAYGNGRFVALAGTATVTVSSDGVNWVERQTGALITPSAIAYGNGRFVAVGSRGDTNVSLTSPDGVDWVQRQYYSLRGPSAVAYGNSQFVEDFWRNQDSTYIIRHSTDGLNRFDGEPITPAYAAVDSLAYGSSFFVAVGRGQGYEFVNAWWGVRWPATVLTSTDGMTWVPPHTATPPIDLSAIAYGNGHFVAVGPGGVILQSGSIVTLGLTQKARTGSIELSLSGPTGLGYTIQSSTDLISWRNLTNITSVQPSTIVLDALPAGSDGVFYRAYSQ